MTDLSINLKNLGHPQKKYYRAFSERPHRRRRHHHQRRRALHYSDATADIGAEGF